MVIMISLLSLERITKNAGIKRISREALEELQEILLEEGREIAERAVKLSVHANRRTVMESDVKLASSRKE